MQRKWKWWNVCQHERNGGPVSSRPDRHRRVIRRRRRSGKLSGNTPAERELYAARWRHERSVIEHVRASPTDDQRDLHDSEPRHRCVSVQSHGPDVADNLYNVLARLLCDGHKPERRFRDIPSRHLLHKSQWVSARVKHDRTHGNFSCIQLRPDTRRRSGPYKLDQRNTRL